jgi:hypothetical protein
MHGIGVHDVAVHDMALHDVAMHDIAVHCTRVYCVSMHSMDVSGGKKPIFSAHLRKKKKTTFSYYMSMNNFLQI